MIKDNNKDVMWWMCWTYTVSWQLVDLELVDEVLQVTAIVRVPVTAVNENPMLKALFAFHFYEYCEN